MVEDLDILGETLGTEERGDCCLAFEGLGDNVLPPNEVVGADDDVPVVLEVDASLIRGVEPAHSRATSLHEVMSDMRLTIC
jgi:hypothetical protein